MRRIGIISDTHGLLRAEAATALSGSDVILHAGDVGSEEVFRQLQDLAPVVAIRGNVDTGAWAKSLPLTVCMTVDEVLFFLIHNISDLSRYPAPPDARVVVYGHSHKPSQSERDGVCYLNPGSAGRRRFSLPVTLALGHVDSDSFDFSFVDLLVGS